MSDRVPTALREQVRSRARQRCEYCKLHEDDAYFGHQPDHIIASESEGMDSKSPQVALLPIHPQFAEAILSGTKRVEFRRRGFGRDVGVVVIYATKPVGKVVGWFEVDGIEHCHPNELWERFENCGGIGRDEFDDYYRDRSEGVAIRVRKVSRLVKPLELSKATDLATPPQSFAYLEARSSQRLLRTQTEKAEAQRHR